MMRDTGKRQEGKTHILRFITNDRSTLKVFFNLKRHINLLLLIYLLTCFGLLTCTSKVLNLPH